MQTYLLHSELKGSLILKVYIVHIFPFFSVQVMPSEMRAISISARIHPERRKTIRSGLVPTRSCNFCKSCEAQRPVAVHPKSQLALKKLWNIQPLATVFTIYPKAGNHNVSDSDTLLQSWNASVNLPSHFPTSSVSYFNLTLVTFTPRRLRSWVVKSTLSYSRTQAL